MEKFNWIIIVALGIIAISQLIINFLNSKKYKLNEKYIDYQHGTILRLENNVLNKDNTCRMLDFLHKRMLESYKVRGDIIEALNQEVNEIEAAHKKTVKIFDELIVGLNKDKEKLELMINTRDAAINNLHDRVENLTIENNGLTMRVSHLLARLNEFSDGPSEH